MLEHCLSVLFTAEYFYGPEAAVARSYAESSVQMPKIIRLIIAVLVFACKGLKIFLYILSMANRKIQSHTMYKHRSHLLHGLGKQSARCNLNFLLNSSAFNYNTYNKSQSLCQPHRHITTSYMPMVTMCGGDYFVQFSQLYYG